MKCFQWSIIQIKQRVIIGIYNDEDVANKECEKKNKCEKIRYNQLFDYDSWNGCIYSVRKYIVNTTKFNSQLNFYFKTYLFVFFVLFC